MATLRVGLTGGIGSGKSTVARLFRELGAPVIDADDIARDLVQPGMPALERIAEAFGCGILGESGELDRKALRRRIFADAGERRLLENILHPLVYREMHLQESALDAPYSILCVPLLLETAPRGFVHRVLLVDCSTDTQIRRASCRDHVAEPEIRHILSSQLPREERLRRADDVIDNEGTVGQLDRQVREFHRRYLRLAETRRRQAPGPSRAGLD